eukprot:gnl/TRDRNA2_/TRDRNA2_29773_c0_seq1.p1 gnl/TRDRNA2_/TRDRNA2_29773_c0~~gnl/TRDRNA2_/TRDRNA2_29773_c0_seq1.p1  ORF type:complete len:640 (-),score=118.70 gnl/TRDRNA2_/TRDRNA2_29773_c0_seq1:58-1977(-)
MGAAMGACTSRELEEQAAFACEAETQRLTDEVQRLEGVEKELRAKLEEANAALEQAKAATPMASKATDASGTGPRLWCSRRRQVEGGTSRQAPGAPVRPVQKFSASVTGGLAPQKMSSVLEIAQRGSSKNILEAEGDFVPEFLNSMLEYMWPSISAFLSETVISILEPKIRKALGPLGSQFSFDRDACSFGDKEIVFKQMFVKRSKQMTQHGEIENLAMRADLEWLGNPNIKMKLSSAALGLSKLEIKGKLLIEFVGMKPRPPFFDGVRYGFINSPSVDIAFLGVTSLMNMDFLKHKILGVIQDVICNLLVVPNMKGKLLDTKMDYFSIMKPRPVGILTLFVERAEGLPNFDTSLYDQATGSVSDPYVELRCGAQALISPVIKDNLSPEFNFTALLKVNSLEHQRVRMTIFDEDPNLPLCANKDDILGMAILPVEELIRWSPGEKKEIELADERGEVGQRGKCWLSARWQPLVLMPPANLGTGEDLAGLVFVGIYGALNVPLAEEGTVFWVVATCSEPMQGVTPGPLETKHIVQEIEMPMDDPDAVQEHHEKAKNLKPLEWLAAFEFLAEPVGRANVHFELKSNNPKNKNKAAGESTIGSCDFEVAKLIATKSRTIECNMDMTASGICLRFKAQVRVLT